MQSPERVILQLLLDGLISTTAAQQYLNNVDFWRQMLATFPTDTWVGVDNGLTYQGSTFQAVRRYYQMLCSNGFELSGVL